MSLKLILILSICLFFIASCKNKDEYKRIDPQQSFIDSLPKEAISKVEIIVPPDYDTLLWQEITSRDKILLDIKYAGLDNFVQLKLYDCARCFVRPAVANKLIKIHKTMNNKGLGLKLFDCYRPRFVQQALWDKVPDARYVTPPKKGSMHNKGAAIDLTIVDSTGAALDMGTDYDYFGYEAYHTYIPNDSTVKQNRKLLKSIMEENGFRSIRTEWWHYSFIQDTFSFSNWSWPCKTSEIK